MKSLNEIIAGQLAQGEASAQNNHREGVENAIFGTEMPKKPINPSMDACASSGAQAVQQDGFKDLPTFSKGITKNFPQFMQKCIARFKHMKKNENKNYYYGILDMVILTVLTVVSSMLPNVRFLYRRDWYYSNLMLIVVAMAGMGKGAMDAVFNLVMPLHNYHRKRYEESVKAYNEQQEMFAKMTAAERRNYVGEVLEKPEQLFFRIPTDCTYAAFMKALVRLKGMGALLDTEIDTMVNAFKQEMADYSVLVRKNFEHETHPYYRKTEDEYCNIAEPKYAMALSGTLDQLLVLMPSAQNGFFSRIMYYFLWVKPVWMDAEDEEDVEEDDKTFFARMGESVFALYRKLENRSENPVRFIVTKSQIAKFNKFFKAVHVNYTSIEGDGIHASVVRLATMFKRIAFVLTMIRIVDLPNEEQDKALEKTVVCNNKDFNSAMAIVKVLLEHMAWYYEKINNINTAVEANEEEVVDLGDENKNKAFTSLPSNKELTTEDIVKAFVANNVPESTAKKQIARLSKKLYLKKIRHGVYRKGNPDEYLMNNKKTKAKSAKAKK